ncbi:MAG: UDP-N-acetylmuramoyl-L-alanyl-D-glutamate--2,6-diaminopimelate ligase [Nitrosomonadaceae bacterium]|nr:UDP-N-acetylmuramoyl-L-alanyl-D-glutamate--2,6-diaminopimelate ligase [Nitrosomonadaceae bacterium]
MKTGDVKKELQSAGGVEKKSDDHLITDLGVKIHNLVTDSREVKPGDTFLACVGNKFDACEFIPQAISAGANAILWERHHDFSWNPGWQVPNLPIDGLRKKTGIIADQVYGHPTQKLWVIGVTGTNGKTSCSHWIAQAMGALGRKTAVIGTLGDGFLGALMTTTNTTPDGVQLQKRIAYFLKQNTECVAMEVSSHGIKEERISGTTFSVALFTNLTRDHLDYHKDMKEYGAVKARLFHWPGLKYAVLNMDDEFGVELAQQLEATHTKVIGYGFKELKTFDIETLKIRMLKGSNLKSSIDGLEFDVEFGSERTKFKTRVVGRFNASNLLSVMATLIASDVKLVDAVQVMQQVQPVMGRMERLGGQEQPLVVVDYAHSPDALEKVLTTLREILNKPKDQNKTRTKDTKLVCVFGCGGERDRGKRPMLGKVASKLADEVIITSDNPRSENPRNIINEIAAAADANYYIEEDRAMAIYRAISSARKGDIVLIAGKGHEMYQEIRGQRLPFSDTEVARQVLQGLVKQEVRVQA